MASLIMTDTHAVCAAQRAGPVGGGGRGERGNDIYTHVCKCIFERGLTGSRWSGLQWVVRCCFICLWEAVPGSAKRAPVGSDSCTNGWTRHGMWFVAIKMPTYSLTHSLTHS